MGIRAAILAVCIVLLAAPAGMAGPGTDKAGRSAEPKRSYGSIDVILYQTSW